MKKIVFLSTLLMVVGCTTTIHPKTDYLRYVRAATQDIDYSNGLDEREVVIWAQYLLIREGVHESVSSMEPVKIEKKTYWVKDDEAFSLEVAPTDLAGFEKKETWVVYFPKKRWFSGRVRFYPLYVEFDAQNGELMHLGLKEK